MLSRVIRESLVRQLFLQNGVEPGGGGGGGRSLPLEAVPVCEHHPQKNTLNEDFMVDQNIPLTGHTNVTS